MPLTADERRVLLLADRSRDAGKISAAVALVLAANPSATLFEVEAAFRDGAAHSYVIVGAPFEIVIGKQAWIAALGRVGLSPQEHRKVLQLVPLQRLDLGIMGS
jgi:hypothetical protein